MQILSKTYEDFVKGNVLASFEQDTKNKATTQGLSKAEAEEKFGKDAEYFTKSNIESFEKAVIEKAEATPEQYKEIYEAGFGQLNGLEKAVVEGHIVYVRKKGE